MKTIFFHGELAQGYPDGIRVHADTAAEALGALRNFPGWVPGVDNPRQVFLPDFQSRDALYERTAKETIHVYPISAGAGGKAGWVQIAIGIALVVFSGGIGSVAFGLMSGVGSAAAAASIAAAASSMGMMMALSGIVSVLSPSPKSSNNAGGKEEKSAYLPANGNTVRAGTRIPLLLGRAKAFGHVLSFQVSSSNWGEAVDAKPPIPVLVEEEITVVAADPEYNVTVQQPWDHGG